MVSNLRKCIVFEDLIERKNHKCYRFTKKFVKKNNKDKKNLFACVLGCYYTMGTFEVATVDCMLIDKKK